MRLLLILIFMIGMNSSTAQDWQSLFDGEDMNGWSHVGEGSFVIEDGLLKTVGGMGLLWYTQQKFENVKVKVIYKGADKNNAGVFIRIPEKPTEPWMPVNRGYEVQIADNSDAYHRTGVLYSFTKAKSSPMKQGWNEMVITMDGDKTLVHVNGVLVTEFNEGDKVPPKKEDYEPERGPRPQKGYIGLQNHDETDVVYFKEVSVMKLKP